VTQIIRKVILTGSSKMVAVVVGWKIWNKSKQNEDIIC